MWHLVFTKLHINTSYLSCHLFHFDLHSCFDVWDILCAHVVGLESWINERSDVQKLLCVESLENS